MKPITQYIMIAATLLFGFGGGGALEAQTTSEMAREGRPALAAPIRVVGAQIREVPSSFMRKLAKGEVSRPVEVLDLSVEVSSRALEAFAPSLQPRLHIGGKSYPVQRVEHSNWDARNEKPIDKKAPVGETQTYHFFIEDWREVEPGQLMILSVLSAEEIKKATDGRFTVERLNRIMPEVTRKIPRYAPREFMKLGP
ncbi:MAG: hypothetical protein ACYSWU_16355 [Planctomycetota bacterium]|jgi:hypothetical protein